MSKQMTILPDRFDFHDHQLRSLSDEAGDPWFVAKDVCDILGLDNVTIALRSLDYDEKTNITNCNVGGISTVLGIDTSNGGRAPLIISEPGLYKLIMRSRKPEAKEFQRWVTHTVLPSIRRHGTYTAPTPTDDDDPTLIARALLAAQHVIETTRQQLEQTQRQRDDMARQTAQLLPKASALDAYTQSSECYTLQETAQLLANTGLEIGRQRLANWMLANKWLTRTPYGSLAASQHHINLKHLRLQAIPRNDRRGTNTRILVTAKGLDRLRQDITPNRGKEER